MKFNTAVCFVILGTAASLRLDEGQPTWIWRVLGLLAMLVAGLTLVEILFSIDLRIDQLLVSDWSSPTATPGRMSGPSAISLFLLSISIFTAGLLADRMRRLALYLVLALGLSIFLSYPFSLAYGANLFSYTGMALQTSILLVILSTVLLLEMPSRGWVEVVLSNSPLGENTRSLLAAALLVPFVLGWLIFYGERAGWYPAGLSGSTYAVAVMLLTAIVVIYNANRLHQAESSQKILQSDLFLVQRQLQALMDHSPAAIFLKNPDGRYQLVNNQFERLVNRPRTQILGKKAQALFSQGLLHALLESDRRVLETRGFVVSEITKDQDGITHTFLNTKFPLLSENGEVQSIGGIWTDITDQKHLSETLNAKNVDLERSNKELEQFAYVASHDLQEPLRMVSSYMQLLESRYKDKLDQDAQDFIDYAVDGALRMQRLIQDLLAFSRVGTRGKDPVPVDASLVLEEALLNLKMRIEETNAAIQIVPLPTVLADKDQMVQVFQNLIGNALKFKGEKPPEILVSVQESNGFAEFAVEDNGIGFDPKHADRIFVLFQRLNTRDKYEGTGIGLAICKKIVERHGGRIWVDSQLGKGSAFHFTFQMPPAAKAEGETIGKEMAETIEDRASRLI